MKKEKEEKCLSHNYQFVTATAQAGQDTWYCPVCDSYIYEFQDSQP